MAKKKNDDSNAVNNNTNGNHNSNINNITINRSDAKEKQESHWLVKAVVAGLISLTVGIIVYKLNQDTDHSPDKGKVGMTIQSDQPVQGVKQTK